MDQINTADNAIGVNSILLIKKRLIASPSTTGHSNKDLAMALNGVLITRGFILSNAAYEAYAEASAEEIQATIVDLEDMLSTLVPSGDDYSPLIKNFPEGTLAFMKEGNLYSQLCSYYLTGEWSGVETVSTPITGEDINVESLKTVDIADNVDLVLRDILNDIVFSSSSISKMDKIIVTHLLEYGVDLRGNTSNIPHKETKAFVISIFLDMLDDSPLDTKNATDVLRTWAVYSGGDEGLVEPTKFKSPRCAQRRTLLATLDQCTNLEDSFKMYREMWLKLLHPLHPGTAKNQKKYPTVAAFADKLRNSPKELRTFESYVAEKVEKRDESVFTLLKRRPGAFSRKLDHMVRVFGDKAVDEWLDTDVNLDYLISTFNHFHGRDKESNGRSAVLASSTSSTVVSYKDVETLSTETVDKLRDGALEKIKTKLTSRDKKAYISPSLFFRPLKVNNRASSASLNGSVSGKVIELEADKTLRSYIMWEGRSDIDLSGFVIDEARNVTKIGWNTSYASKTAAIIYSGDNTGNYKKNSEYLDIYPERFDDGEEWVLTTAVIYAGPSTYAKYPKPVYSGVLALDAPKTKDRSWNPSDLSEAMLVSADSRNVYLTLVHLPTNRAVYLDISNNSSGSITNDDDALQIIDHVINKGILEADQDGEITTIRQGHLLSFVFDTVDDPAEADIVFDEDTQYEEVLKYIN